MKSGNLDITLEDHFKLYVLFKDTIIFENELIIRNINYLYDPVETMQENVKRYYLRVKDKDVIDDLILTEGIVASTETIAMTDYDDVKKANKLLFDVAASVILIIIIFIII